MWMWFALSALADDEVCYDLEEVNVPDGKGGTLFTSWYGVNDHDVFVGNFCIDPSCNPTGVSNDLVDGVIYDSHEGTFTSFRPPVPYNWVGNVRINNRGDVVGEAINGAGDRVAFQRDTKGVITILAPPAAGVTHYAAYSINDAGVIVGEFADPSQGGKTRGFILERGKYTLYDTTAPLGGSTTDISNGGTLVGQDFLTNASGGLANVGFIDEGDGPVKVEVPGAARTFLWGVNDHGDLAGFANFPGSPSSSRTAYVRRDGTFAFFDWPGATTTYFFDVNDAGVVAGTFDFFSFGLIAWPCDD